MNEAIHLSHPRSVEKVVAGMATSDGAGVKLTRLLHGALQRRLDPFLMLDAFGSEHPGDYIAGFPDHPHRGFETVTLMIEGRMRHRDSAGHDGLLSNGGVQWMIAGRGVIHSEMPEQEQGAMSGFQLWLNLPAAEKMRAPWYRDVPRGELPLVALEGIEVRVVAGSFAGIDGAVQRPTTEPLYLDLSIDAGKQLSIPIQASHNAFVAVAQGMVRIGEATVPAGQMAVLANAADSDGIEIEAKQKSRLIVVAGKPLGEPIAQYGPFVMNTQEEIQQAIADYRAGRFA